MDINKSAIDQILNSSGGKIDRDTLEKATKSGDAQSLVNSLSDKDKQKLNNILNDKEQLEQVLKSPQAQMLLKMFGGKNG
ncbi:MAG: hypothetical protein IKK55_02445 [Clostridia bacterium]|nr:hypothetical protein [Clostridia bacterium]MBR6741175.1 hypothetical protein [Clostridia bacterium]